MNISVVIVTKNAGKELVPILTKLQTQNMPPSIITVFDSASEDGTDIQARKMGVSVVSVATGDFNHGATREMARKHSKSDIVIFMTQDAIPVDNHLIDKLVEPIESGKASFSYARQIPRRDADLFESHPRQFNYPHESHIRGIEDINKFGVYTFFCSDSCAAYLNSALDEIGGFRPTLTNEDYLAAARLMQKGHKVAYVADAIVEHSHSYTLWHEFQRYFDTGYVRAENYWIQTIAGQAEGRGKEYFRSLVVELAKSHPWLIIYAILDTFMKLLGYRVGFWSLNTPKWWKRLCSGQKYFWDSKYYIS